MAEDVRKDIRRRRYGVLWSVGQVARLVNAAPETVRRWIDSGKLDGNRMPSGERRVHRDVLRRFLTDHGYTWALPALDARALESPPKPRGPTPADEAPVPTEADHGDEKT